MCDCKNKISKNLNTKSIFTKKLQSRKDDLENETV